MDGDGTFCVYEWAADHSNCLRKTVSGAAMASQPVALDADAAAKAKGMQQITAQWKDAKCNFYFLADKDGDMVAKTAYYLVKVNAQGKIEAELASRPVDSKYDRSSGKIQYGTFGSSEQYCRTQYFDYRK